MTSPEEKLTECRVATHVATQAASAVTKWHLANSSTGRDEPKRSLAALTEPSATTVRDREDEGSNPSPPTIFVFKIGDFRGCLESADHSRITIS